MIVMLYLSETSRDGNYESGGVLFVSSTSSVDVRFTSNWAYNYPGFTLDVRSIDCADRTSYPLAERLDLNGGYFPCKVPGLVVLAAREFRKNALALKTDSDGNYLNQDDDSWHIFTVEGQVSL